MTFHECRITNIILITLANHGRSQEHNEPIRTGSNLSYPDLTAALETVGKQGYEIKLEDNAITILGEPGAVSRGRAKLRDKSFQERARMRTTCKT